jgi:hypothetical protein
MGAACGYPSARAHSHRQQIRSQDGGTSGSEKLTSPRANGQLLVRVKSFGIGETDGGYRLAATDLGG